MKNDVFSRQPIEQFDMMLGAVRHPAFRLGAMDAREGRPLDHDFIFERCFGVGAASQMKQLLEDYPYQFEVAQLRYEEGKANGFDVQLTLAWLVKPVFPAEVRDTSSSYSEPKQRRSVIVTLHHGAPLVDLGLMLERSPPAAAIKLGTSEIAKRLLTQTRSFSAWGAGRCLACGGLYDHRDGRLEAWFACRSDAGDAIGSIVRQARLTLRLIAETERVEIFATVAAGWTPGQRLARAVGFRLLEGGPVERWGM